LRIVLRFMETDDLKEFIVREFGDAPSLDAGQWTTAKTMFEELPAKRELLIGLLGAKKRPGSISHEVDQFVATLFPIVDPPASGCDPPAPTFDTGM
jgi:hypothetical protein